MPGMAPAIPLRHRLSFHTNGSMAMCCSGSHTVPSSAERQQRMTIVHHATRDVDVRNRVAVQKKLLLDVIEEQRCDGNRANQQREARIVALLLQRDQDCLPPDGTFA